MLTNLPKSVPMHEAVRMTYQRCDQENVVEQLQSGVATMKLPTGGFLVTHAYPFCARFADNLKAWLAMLALPRETMRWERKRFRKSFVQTAARVVHCGRPTLVRFADSHRFAGKIAKGIEILPA